MMHERMEPAAEGVAPAAGARTTPWDDRRARLQDAVGGRYRVGERIGGGPSGDVFRAVHGATGAAVALKLLALDPGAMPERFDAVAAEIRVAQTLEHDRVVRPFSIERVDDVAYYAMPFLSGRSLEDTLRAHESLPFERIIEVLTDVAAALDHIHDHGVVHHAVKPGNILLDARGRVHLADLGVADALRGSHSAVGTRDVASGAYEAPEQWRGQRPGFRSDQFALAVIAYELITGQRRLDAPQVEGIQTLEPLEVLSYLPLRQNLGLHVNAALRRALSVGPAHRFPSVTAFVDALAGRGQEAPHGLPTKRFSFTLVRRHHVAGVLGVVLAMMAGALLASSDAQYTMRGYWTSFQKRLARAPDLDLSVPASSVGSQATAGSGPGAPGFDAAGLAAGRTTPSGRSLSLPSPTPPSAARGARVPPVDLGGLLPSSAGALAGAAASRVVGPSLAPTLPTVGGRGGPAPSNAPTPTFGSPGTAAAPASGGAGPAAGPGSAAGQGTSGSAVSSAGGAPTGSVASAAVANVRSLSTRLMGWITGARPQTLDGHGFIRVSVSEGSAVAIVDGLPRGMTPTVVSVPPGAHTVSVQGVTSGYAPARAEIVVGARDTVGALFRRAGGR